MRTAYDARVTWLIMGTMSSSVSSSAGIPFVKCSDSELMYYKLGH
jgi:hypothetical protein